MNIREKEIMEKFRSEDPIIRERQVHDVFYGKGEETKALRETVMKVVRFSFSDKIYWNRKEEIYKLLVPLIWENFVKADESTINGIENLPGYFYKVAKNCANKNRDYIDDSLGIIRIYIPLEEKHEDKADEDESNTGIVDVFSENKPNFEGMRQTEIAEILLNEYINRIPRKVYRDVLYAIDLKGWTHEQIVKEYGINKNRIDQYHRYAKMELTRIALPDIKQNYSTFFRKNSQLLSPKDAEILDNFFSGKGESKTRDITATYMKLVKKVRKQREEEENEIKKEIKRIQRIIK